MNWIQQSKLYETFDRFIQLNKETFKSDVVITSENIELRYEIKTGDIKITKSGK